MNTDTRGKCYAAARDLYQRLGGKPAGLTPMMCYVEEPYGPATQTVTHWYLRWEHEGTTYYVDPTADQFDKVPDYASGRGFGFRGVRPFPTNSTKPVLVKR